MDITTNAAPGNPLDIATSAVLIKIPDAFRDSNVPILCFVDESGKFLGAITYSNDEFTFLGGKGIVVDPQNPLAAITSGFKPATDRVEFFASDFGAGKIMLIYPTNGHGDVGGMFGNVRRPWRNADFTGIVNADGGFTGPGTVADSGRATLVNGTVTVTSAKLTASSRITLGYVDCVNPGFLSAPTANGARDVTNHHFVIQSTSGTDGSTVEWMLTNP